MEGRSMIQTGQVSRKPAPSRSSQAIRVAGEASDLEKQANEFVEATALPLARLFFSGAASFLLGQGDLKKAVRLEGADPLIGVFRKEAVEGETDNFRGLEVQPQFLAFADRNLNFIK